MITENKVVFRGQHNNNNHLKKKPLVPRSQPQPLMELRESPPPSICRSSAPLIGNYLSGVFAHTHTLTHIYSHSAHMCERTRTRARERTRGGCDASRLPLLNRIGPGSVVALHYTALALHCTGTALHNCEVCAGGGHRVVIFSRSCRPHARLKRTRARTHEPSE